MPPSGPAAQPGAPLVKLLVFLSVTTGLVDAVSVLGLGNVFTANMTGNIVFLGFAAVGTPGFKALHYVVALAAFFFGALLGGWTGVRFADRPLRHWLISAASIEVVLLGSAAAVATRIGATRIGIAAQTPQLAVLAVIALTAIAMGVRNATVRRLKIPDLTTTVLTLTVTGIAADSPPAGGKAPNLARRLGSIAAIFLGAAVGAVLVTHLGLTPPLLLAGAMVLVGTLLLARHPATALPHRA
jgi:uncharacterized membrane protein YoaK (UPF0700 family)